LGIGCFDGFEESEFGGLNKEWWRYLSSAPLDDMTCTLLAICSVAEVGGCGAGIGICSELRGSTDQSVMVSLVP